MGLMGSDVNVSFFGKIDNMGTRKFDLLSIFTGVLFRAQTKTKKQHFVSKTQIKIKQISNGMIWRLKGSKYNDPKFSYFYNPCVTDPDLSGSGRIRTFLVACLVPEVPGDKI
jgi:hypothetical protein